MPLINKPVTLHFCKIPFYEIANFCCRGRHFQIHRLNLKSSLWTVDVLSFEFRVCSRRRIESLVALGLGNMHSPGIQFAILEPIFSSTQLRLQARSQFCSLFCWCTAGYLQRMSLHPSHTASTVPQVQAHHIIYRYVCT